MSIITTLIADHQSAYHAACLDTLKIDGDIRVVGTAQNVLDVVSAAAKLKPRILLLGFTLFHESGYALLLALRQESPGTKVILLCEHASKGEVLNALRYGAKGCLEKKDIHAFLAKSVRAVDAGEAWVPRRITTAIAERLFRLSL